MFHCSVRKLGRELSAAEFQEWWELYCLEPWGDDWHQASMIAAVSQSVWMKGRIRTDKFVPRKKRPAQQRRDPKDLEIQLRHFAAMHNAAQDRKPSK